VLLRLLEYQSGIVILTTNRRKDFDPAFYSRIHVSIEYGKLSASEKEAIWRWEIEKGGWGSDALSRDDFAGLAKLDMDGRTIKNVIHVLKLFTGSEERDSLSLASLKQVLDIATGNLDDDARKKVDEFINSGD